MRDLQDCEDAWFAMDLETTGLSPTRDAIRELALVPLKNFGASADSERAFVAEELRSPVSGEGRAFLQKVAILLGEEARIVAHNAAFDVAFLAETLRRARIVPFSLRAYCTLRLARRLVPGLARYDLASVCDNLGLEAGAPHVAIDDARTVARLFDALARLGELESEEGLRALHGPPVSARAGSGPFRLLS